MKQAAVFAFTMLALSPTSTRRTLLERAKVSGYGLDMWFSPSHCWKHQCDILINDKHLIVVQYILNGAFPGVCYGAEHFAARGRANLNLTGVTSSA